MTIDAIIQQFKDEFEKRAQQCAPFSYQFHAPDNAYKHGQVRQEFDKTQVCQSYKRLAQNLRQSFEGSFLLYAKDTGYHLTLYVARPTSSTNDYFTVWLPADRNKNQLDIFFINRHDHAQPSKWGMRHYQSNKGQEIESPNTVFTENSEIIQDPLSNLIHTFCIRPQFSTPFKSMGGKLVGGQRALSWQRRALSHLRF